MFVVMIFEAQAEGWQVLDAFFLTTFGPYFLFFDALQKMSVALREHVLCRCFDFKKQCFVLGFLKPRPRAGKFSKRAILVA